MIHGERAQAKRSGALKGFQDGGVRMLVATDIASRGLHVEEVLHVINYGMPTLAEDFVHCVGRTARTGAQGRASTLVAGSRGFRAWQNRANVDLRIERKQIGFGRPAPAVQNTLASWTLNAIPGEIFVEYGCQTFSPHAAYLRFVRVHASAQV